MTAAPQPAISSKTRLVGLLGWPVSHSLSPAMQNAAARALGLDLLYLPLPVHPVDLGDAVRGLAALGFHGANVTVPHKETVMDLVDEVDPAAAIIGAVNTIVVDRDEDGLGPAWLTGFNTDRSGFLADLAGLDFKPAGKTCLVLGAGGAARAVVYALAATGARVHVFARRLAQVQDLVRELSPHLPAATIQAHDLRTLAERSQRMTSAAEAESLIVNTTPVGMMPQTDRSPWPDTAPLPPQTLVYDLVYSPAETRLMRQAREAGCRTANGLGMLVHQGAEAFYLWTGLRPDIAVMRRAIGA